MEVDDDNDKMEIGRQNSGDICEEEERKRRSVM